MANSACIDAKDEEYHLDLRLEVCVLCVWVAILEFFLLGHKKRPEIHHVTYGGMFFLFVFM